MSTMRPSAWSAEPDITITGVFPILPMAEVRPGCNAMPCAMTSPHWAGATTVASVRPTPLPPIVMSRS
jgi:hypothetical protein